jgi:5-methylcytosine-specific restriction enzyme A
MRPIDPYLRKQPWKSDGKGPTGRNLCCCGCGREVGHRRSSSHSQECVERWRAHSDLNSIKYKVERRDKGVCALCGTDTEKLKQRIITLVARAMGWQDRHWGSALSMMDGNWKVRRIREILVRHRWPTTDRRWWEADHIVPVAEGGGGCDFNGYRTLCCPCHKAETKKLAGRLAKKRKCA